MKIGIVSREYPPLTHVGGIGTYSAAAAKLLANHGHEVHVLCNGATTSVTRSEGITVHRIVMGKHHFSERRILYPYRAWYRRNLPHYLDALTWARTVTEYFKDQLLTEKFDVWELPETMGEGALMKLNESAHRPIIVCRIHTGWTDDCADNALERRLLLNLQRRACLAADRLVSPSAFMAGDYVRKVLRISQSVSVSRNPLLLWDKPVDWEAKRMRNILYVGRVEHRKGLQVLLAALDELGPEAEGVTLRVVGAMHPPTRESDRRCVEMLKSHLGSARLRSAALVEYAGVCDHADMPRHFDWAGVQVIPSLMENYPYAALEGLSRGCYLLGSDVGGIPEIIDRPERGMLFAAENSTQLAGKIRECMRQDRKILGNMRSVAESIRAEFSAESGYLRLMEAYGVDLRKRVEG